MPRMQCPRHMLPMIHSKKRFVILVGGRDSAKSGTIARHLIRKCQTEGARILCGREYQNSIEDSVKYLIDSVIIEDKLNGFKILDKKIDHRSGGGFRFKGFARNPHTIKSAQGFKICWIDESDQLTSNTLADLIPTIRESESQIYFSMNPQCSQDPFAQEFIVPYYKELKKNGIYEDDLHLIIWCNWRTNPWHKELRKQREKDYFTKSMAWYNWQWEGDWRDEISMPLIKSEWFDACIDADKTLGYKAQGIRLSSHDPADEGEDAKAFAFRWGSVVLDLQEKVDEDINAACDWATDLALQHKSDAFVWDAIGVGAGLKRQISKTFQGKSTLLSQFISSESADFPDAIYEPCEDDKIQNQRRNKDVFRNKRAQYYWVLRDRIYRTYRAVVHKEYNDPEKMIAFSSDIAILSKLRSELCRIPRKVSDNGFNELYTKLEMKSKFRIDSPNLADSVMMLMRVPTNPINQTSFRPRPIRPMGRR